ncbi:conserved hypothetical protein [Verticillium alfalfae VaMs.102]|uniref:CCHC-type domain-containing protein n=1 Tax=Verticillium alfalfae (strain VaMs.102 / ATCC MYA-4576 / FGSC 10136) TaxID=526221 RepID=C9SZ20_VERA1|nr:conserved hypothetical protein [Verticillium alfalfae VaMs.102]EEY24035.1 conserved hypothetical protein [Verticillium alfalfae VaMs.102]
MVTERDTINVASDEEERDGGERRQLRPRPKPSNKAIGNRATDNEAIEDEAIDNQATDNATDDAEVTKRRTKGRGTKSTVRRPISGTNGGQLDGRALLRDMQKQLERQTSILEQVLGESQAQAARIEELQNQVNELKEAQHATTTEVQALRESIVASTATAAEQRRAEASYADVARMSPTSNARPSTTVAPPTQADTLFCTIDLSRIENEQDEQLTPGAVRILTEDKVRAEQGQDNWRCLAVTKDSKKSRIRIACRNEEELKLVKRVVESKLPREARMLRDDLYRVKVNYVKRTVVLDEKDKIRIDIAKQIGQENNVQIAKISWLSINGPPKEYGSMAVYLTKASDAEKLLTDRFMYAGGESGRTEVWEHRVRPDQCYNCQQVGTGHRAYQCSRPQVCGGCAREGHHHSTCDEAILKCVPCGGPYASFSRNTLNTARRQLRVERRLPDSVGKLSKEGKAYICR